MDDTKTNTFWRFWPTMLMVAVVALLPFARWSGLPVLIICLASLGLIIRRGAVLWSNPNVRLLVGLWLCYWLPMVIGSLDAVEPVKSWTTTGAATRFLLLGLFAIHYLASAEQRLRLWRWTAWMVLAWAIDALVQAAFGVNLLGMPMSDDRLNGIFGPTSLKLGPVLAVLSPLLLEHARNHWRRWAFVASYGVLLTAIVLIGTRAAWVVYAVVTVCYLVHYAGRHPGRWLRSLVWVGILVVTVGPLAYHFSANFQQRFDRSLLLLSGNRIEMDVALSRRVPIWQTSIRMALDHPVNGVGPRGFRYAYLDYSDVGDPWNNKVSNTGAAHAHQLLLELATETGLFGLIGLLVALRVAVRHWKAWGTAQRYGSRPFAIALAGMLFPLNTHLAFYSTFWSLVFWWLVALYCVTAREE